MQKSIFVLLSVFFFLSSFGQDIRATTEDGKKLVLKKDMTWEYEKSATAVACSAETNFKEPVGDKGNQAFLKAVNATVADMKKHVSVDLGVSEKDIVLLELSEQKGNAIYVLCINGNKFKYRRTGSAFFKDGAEPYKANN